MNTADRSLASLDIALRRRFKFEEVPPNPELLADIPVPGIRLDKLLHTMNQRIEVLLNRDHMLGHSYFLPLRQEPTLERLGEIFRTQILPLLEEYFFEDWDRIRWVLNDHRKDPQDQFLIKPEVDLTTLLGEEIEIPVDKHWEKNLAAFSNLASYIGIIGD